MSCPTLHQGLKQQIPEKIDNANVKTPAPNKIIPFPGFKEKDGDYVRLTSAKGEAKARAGKGKIIAVPVLNGLHHDYRRVA